MMAVALGRSRATGRFGNNRLPSLIVWFLSKYPIVNNDELLKC